MLKYEVWHLEFVRVCVFERCKARVGIGYRSRARLLLFVRLADLPEFIKGMSGRQQRVQLPQNTWPHLRRHTQAGFCGPPSMAGLTSAAARLSVQTEKVLCRFHRSVKRGLVI